MLLGGESPYGRSQAETGLSESSLLFLAYDARVNAELVEHDISAGLRVVW